MIRRGRLDGATCFKILLEISQHITYICLSWRLSRSGLTSVNSLASNVFESWLASGQAIVITLIETSGYRTALADQPRHVLYAMLYAGRSLHSFGHQDTSTLCRLNVKSSNGVRWYSDCDAQDDDWIFEMETKPKQNLEKHIQPGSHSSRPATSSQFTIPIRKISRQRCLGTRFRCRRMCRGGVLGLHRL